VPRIAIFVLLLAALASAGDQTATYQKGTITKKFAADAGYSAQAFYSLQGERSIPYQLKICADFTDGQSVEFRVKGDNVFIRSEGGKDIKCPETVISGFAKPVTYMKGTIEGYETRRDYHISGGGAGGNGTPGNPVSAWTRKAKVYALHGADLTYKVDYCGAFQAGNFAPGQTVEYRVDGERLYIRHEDKEYSCQIEGTLKPEDAKPSQEVTETNAPAPAAAPAVSTAKLSIASTPAGADIDVDGNFSGNTPSDVQVPPGEHAIKVKKTGYKAWERKLTVAAGSSIHLDAELEKETNP